MHNSWTWVAGVLLSACAATASAQNYTIKLKPEPDAGMTVTMRSANKDSGSTKIFDAAGKLVNEVKPTGKEKVYTLTILEREKSATQASKYKQVYEKATETAEGKSRALSYQGRTIVVEQKDGTYRVGVAGKPPLDDKDLDELLKKANEGSSDQAWDKAIAPAKAVAVGEQWTIDPAALGPLLKDFELSKASLAGAKLVRVYTRGKSQFGVIEVNMKLEVKGIGPLVKFDPPAKMEMKVTIDTAIDGSSTARKQITTGKMIGKGTVGQGDKKMTMDMDQAISGEIEGSEEKDDAKVRDVPAVEFVGPGGTWVEFTSKEGRFSATFPAKPEVKTKKDAKGKVTTTCSTTREQGNIYYAVTYTDFAQADVKADPEATLKGIAAAFANDTKEKKDIKLNGHPGIELVREFEQNGVKLAVTQQAFQVSGRLYQAMVVTAVSVKEKAEARKFLDSFQLHEKKGAKAPEKKGKK